MLTADVVQNSHFNMNELLLFTSRQNKSITNIDLLDTLKVLKADECEILFIHSSLSFGTPNPKLKKKELLQSILDVIMSLGVNTICMPTFTFSFCNGQTYDPSNSSSKMGALNEYFRKQDGVIRSIDPLMSVALYGENKELVEDIGTSSCGANCTFDMLRHRNNVKFLFIGPKIGDCLTYMHYLEWLYSVDYRYERKFIGDVTVNKITSRKEYDLFVRYNGVIPNTASYAYEEKMYNNKVAFIESLGDASISIVDKDLATLEYKKCLDINRHFFVDFIDNKFIKDKTFILEKEMIAM